MTSLLERAIAELRDLPPADQDEAAEFLLAIVSRAHGVTELDDNTRAAIRQGRSEARVGAFATAKELSELLTPAKE